MRKLNQRQVAELENPRDAATPGGVVGSTEPNTPNTTQEIGSGNSSEVPPFTDVSAVRNRVQFWTDEDKPRCFRVVQVGVMMQEVFVMRARFKDDFPEGLPGDPEPLSVERTHWTPLGRLRGNHNEPLKIWRRLQEKGLT